MKVLFTASTASHILNFHLPYLEYFQKQGWSVHAACGGAPVSIPCADKVIALPFKKRMWAPENFRAASILRREIRSEGYTLISAHTSLAAFFTRMAVMGLRKRPPVACTVHGYLFDDNTAPAKRSVLLAAERLMAPYTDLLMTMNRWDDALADKYRLGRKTAYIPGVGVDFSRLDGPDFHAGRGLRARYGIPPEAFVILYPAEFSKRKSQEVLIRAVKRLPERAVLVLPGDGALLGKCRTLAVRLGLEGRVVFPGHIKDIGGWYAMADAAVSASRSEGLPFNIMEAMYCGTPVAASAVKGHTDLIRGGETGLLYPYGDADACAGKLLRLMDSRELRQELSANARAAVERYGLERVFPQVIRQYKALLPEDLKNELPAENVMERHLRQEPLAAGWDNGHG